MTLSEWMAAEGLTEAGLAARLGVSPSTVHRLRTGKMDADVPLALRIEEASAWRVDAATLSSRVAAARARFAARSMGGQ